MSIYLSFESRLIPEIHRLIFDENDEQQARELMVKLLGKSSRIKFLPDYYYPINEYLQDNDFEKLKAALPKIPLVLSLLAI